MARDTRQTGRAGFRHGVAGTRSAVQGEGKDSILPVVSGGFAEAGGRAPQAWLVRGGCGQARGYHVTRRGLASDSSRCRRRARRAEHVRSRRESERSDTYSGLDELSVVVTV